LSLIFCCETWQIKTDTFLIGGYEGYCVPRKASVVVVEGTVVSVFSLKKSYISSINLLLLKQITGVLFEQDLTPKNYFKLYDTLYTCFVYIPPSESVYFKDHETDVFKQLEAHTFGKVSIVGDVNARTDIVMILQYLIWNDNKVNDFIEHLNNQTANLQTL